MTKHRWHCRDQILEIGSRALVMGIVNVTPDSFSDGGRHASASAAIQHALRLVDEGADILDIGGESSRPGAIAISLDEELQRVIPVVEEVSRHTSIPLSIDTVKSEVARQALQAGASIINDITALRGDPEMTEVVRAAHAGVILMHMKGTPATMNLNPAYDNVIEEVAEFFSERLDRVVEGGLDPSTVALDPGISFGKTLDHNLQLLRNLSVFQRYGRPLCLGISRKGLFGSLLKRTVENRVSGSVAVACKAIVEGSAQIIRVHDVAEHRDAVIMLHVLHQESR